MCIALLLVSSCSQTNRGINVGAAVQTGEWSFRTFEVRAENMPAFLGPVMASNFSVAMAERGLQPVADHADAIVTLRYDQQNYYSTKPDPRDEFAERIDQNIDTRFVAKIIVEVRSADNEDVVWTGSIQRVHAIRAGDYMHIGRASQALLISFRTLLESFPFVAQPDKGGLE
jgi:hypothetical protein